MHGWIRIGLPKMHGQICISLPKVHGWKINSSNIALPERIKLDLEFLKILNYTMSLLDIPCAQAIYHPSSHHNTDTVSSVVKILVVKYINYVNHFFFQE